MANDFGELMRKLREDRGFTIRKLAVEANVSHTYITNVEKGKRGIPSPEILEKFAGSLGIDYMELMWKAGYMSETVDDQTFAIESQVELMYLLRQSECTFNGHKLTDSEKKRIESVLLAMFPEKFNCINA